MNEFRRKIVNQKIRINTLFNAIKNKDKEKMGIAKYMYTHFLDAFNYDFADDYRKRQNEIFIDEESGLKYIITNNRRMYFKRDMSDKEINTYFNQISLEQDIKSPHLYLTEKLKNRNYGCVIDVGAAEGNFAVQMADRCEKLILFEMDEGWIEALSYTFKYDDNVKIIKSFVSSKHDKDTVTLDALCTDMGKIDLIKMDIEGEEVNALKGSVNILNRDKPICLVCAYHYGKQIEDIINFFGTAEIEIRPGYMVFLQQEKIDKPYLRRGVLEISDYNNINI